MTMLTADELEDLGQGAPQDIVIATAVFDGDKVLLGESREKNIFSIPSGRLEDGETQKVCSLRTVWEETGIACKNSVVVSIYDAYKKDEHKHYVTIGMIADYHSGKITGQVGEQRLCWGWYPSKNVLQFPLSKTDKILMEHFLHSWAGKRDKNI